MTILVGTSGFSYKDWVGPFYPADLPREEWLSYYAEEFPTCELNFTYYRIPDTRTLTRIADKVPAGFQFAVKAFQGITHEREEPAPLIRRFVQALAPLQEAGQFACCIMLCFPNLMQMNNLLDSPAK